MLLLFLLFLLTLKIIDVNYCANLIKLFVWRVFIGGIYYYLSLRLSIFCDLLGGLKFYYHVYFFPSTSSTIDILWPMIWLYRAKEYKLASLKQILFNALYNQWVPTKHLKVEELDGKKGEGEEKNYTLQDLIICLILFVLYTVKSCFSLHVATLINAIFILICYFGMDLLAFQYTLWQIYCIFRILNLLHANYISYICI